VHYVEKLKRFIGRKHLLTQSRPITQRNKPVSPHTGDPQFPTQSSHIDELPKVVPVSSEGDESPDAASNKMFQGGNCPFKATPATDLVMGGL
jgi:hypothetical protein